MNIGQFVRLVRVPTLAATAVPVMVGGAVAFSQSRFDFLPWLDIFGVAILMQIATNTINEYGDFRHAVDTVPSPGIAGLIVSGEVRAREILLIAVVCYAASFLLGVALVFLRGPIMLVLWVAAVLAGLLYSEGPIPISSTPFGEVLVALIMGPIEVVSADLAAAGEISSRALLYSIPVGLMVAAILLTNNLRDLEKDRDHGRRTLAVLIGKIHGSTVLFALIVLAFLWTIPAFLFFQTSWSVFLTWLVFPVALRSFRTLMRGSTWPRSVSMIARIHIIVGILLTFSILFQFG